MAFQWKHHKESKCITLAYHKDTHLFLGINTFGIRMRHEIFDRWLTEKKTINYVIEYLADAKKRIKILTDESLEFKVPFKDVFETYKEDGQEIRTGNKLLPKPCTMCSFKSNCWKDAVLHERITSKAKQPPQVWYSRLKKKAL